MGLATGLAGGAASWKSMLKACFAGKTPILTLDGSRRIDEIRAGDLVLSRDENDPNGPVLPKCVEEVFVRTGRIWVLRVRGQEICTTGEHPFYAVGKGWVEVAKLQPGDLLLSYNGQLVQQGDAKLHSGAEFLAQEGIPGETGIAKLHSGAIDLVQSEESCEVEAVWDTGEYETVYNIRVEDLHTYFVGCASWGWSIWAHNADRCEFDWGSRPLEPYEDLRQQMENAVKTGTVTAIDDVIRTIIGRAVERARASGHTNGSTPENSAAYGLAKLVQMLHEANAPFSIEAQPGFRRVPGAGGKPRYVRALKTRDEQTNFAGTLWPDFTLTDISHGGPRPGLTRGLLLPEVRNESHPQKILRVYDPSLRNVGPTKTRTEKPLVIQKYKGPITQFNADGVYTIGAPLIIDIRVDPATGLAKYHVG